ncbi:MAG: acylneuraminate cytidylyltransferase family protein [Flavobacterium sp.]|nr:acylneuraminate cytidylyltransferase family protein [Flavobacterium sp.]
MKNIALIPARGGSKRLAGKNTKLLGGIPLLAHSIRYAQQFPELIDAVYVSTNDPACKAVALEFGAQVLDRPNELATDDSPTYTCLQHALLQLENTVKTICLLQPTNPLRPANLMSEAYAVFSQSAATSLFTVSRSHQKLGKISDHCFYPFNYTVGQRSQDLEPLYFENGLLYITTPAVLTQNLVFSAAAIPFVVEHPFEQIDIDTLADFEYAEYMVQKHLR